VLEVLQNENTSALFIVLKNNLNPDFLTLLVFEGFVDFFALSDLSKNSKKYH
jgi:hypothetical protein